jgi:hypothetical protein
MPIVQCVHHLRSFICLMSNAAVSVKREKVWFYSRCGLSVMRTRMNTDLLARSEVTLC